jgi:hypothetical protein
MYLMAPSGDDLKTILDVLVGLRCFDHTHGFAPDHAGGLLIMVTDCGKVRDGRFNDVVENDSTYLGL